MPRPRTKDPLPPLLEPIIRRFAAEVAAAVMGFVETRVKQEVETLVGRAFVGARRSASRVAPRRASIRPCRVPGCGKPSKGPRFDFFCEVHRGLPAAEKDAIKVGKGATGDAGATGPAAGGARAKKPARAGGKAKA